MKRTERLKFVLGLDYRSFVKHKWNLKILLRGKLPKCGTNDTVNVTYQVFIDYLGDVAERLAALNAILDDPDGKISISTEELEHGACLIQDVLVNIKKIQERVTDE